MPFFPLIFISHIEIQTHPWSSPILSAKLLPRLQGTKKAPSHRGRALIVFICLAHREQLTTYDLLSCKKRHHQYALKFIMFSVFRL